MEVVFRDFGFGGFFFDGGGFRFGVEADGLGLDGFVGGAGDEVVDDGAGALVFGRFRSGCIGLGSRGGLWFRSGCGDGQLGRIGFADGGDDVAESDFLEVLDGLEGSDFEMQALVGGPLHAAFGFGKSVDDGEESVRFVGIAGFGEVGPEGFGKALASGGWVELGHDECANGSDDFAEELREIFAAFELFVNDLEGPGGVFFENGLEEFGHGFARGEAEDVEDIGFGDFVAAKGDELVEHGLRVAHSAVGTFGNGPGGGVVEFDSFFLRDVLQVGCDDISGNGAEVEALATRDDGGEDLVGFGGGEDELYVLGWFFERLEEGIEGGVREHVDLVDIVDLEACAGGSKGGGFAKGADLLDAVVGGSVDFENVEGAAFGDFDGEGVFGVELDAGTTLGVEGFG